MKLLNKIERQQIVSAIKQAEQATSGEIRVHIESVCNENVLNRAAYLFKKLNMHKTAQRNGVLFYVAINSRQFAILGDTGINATVPHNFWENIKQTITTHFKEGNFAEGLTKGILIAGQQLKTHFPCNEHDKNELCDDISFGQ